MSYQCRLGFCFFSDSPGEPPLWASFGILVENRCSGFLSVFHSCFLPSKNETGSIALGLESPPKGFLNLRKWSKNDRDPTTIEVEVYLKSKNTIKNVVYPVIKGVSQSLRKGCGIRILLTSLLLSRCPCSSSSRCPFCQCPVIYTG